MNPRDIPGNVTVLPHLSKPGVIPLGKLDGGVNGHDLIVGEFGSNRWNREAQRGFLQRGSVGSDRRGVTTDGSTGVEESDQSLRPDHARSSGI